MFFNRLAIVYNPKGGTARQDELLKLQERLASFFPRVDALATTAEPHSAALLANRAVFQLGADLVIAFGGDGTVREVAHSIAGSRVPMAIYPGGTGNLFARTFYAQPTPDLFADFIRNGRPQPVDIIHYSCTDVQGVARGGIALVSIGLGCLSEAISLCDPVWKRRFGRLTYAYNIAKACMRPKLVTAEIERDGEIRGRETIAGAFALNVVPNLTPFLSRGCNPSDGMMDLVTLHARNASQCLSTGMRLATGAPERSPHYARSRVSTARIRADRPIVLDLDGDVGPTTQDVTLTVHGAALKMILV